MNHKTLAVLVLGVASLAAQVPFVGINIGPSPDTLYRFDALNPGAASNTATTATLAGNFIRGLELTAEKTGWYVATSASGGSPTGFFRLDDGVSTLVAPLPFTATAVGGLSFDLTESFLYWVVDPPTGEDELWRIDFDGTFTLIGPISIPGVTAPVIAGLALDPRTDTLYGIETNIDSLITIDQTTGISAVVGTGLGVAISAVGGLDFSLDGTDRLFMAAPTAVYEVDPITGLALTTAGSLPGSTSSIAAIPGQTTLKGGLFPVGSLASIQLTGGPANGLFSLFFSGGTSRLPLPGIGVVGLDLASPFLTEFLTAPLDPNGGFALNFGIGNIPPLSIPLQAAVVDLVTGRLELTNVARFEVP